MAENSKIQWTKHTWSPWRGCAKVSTGCSRCYAEAMSHRNHGIFGVWGPNGSRVVNADWNKPLTWNRQAAKQGVRYRIFPSLCDPFEDRKDLDCTRGAFLELIDDTPQLDWLILTKRPESFISTMERVFANHAGRGGHLAEQWLNGDPPANVWFGVSTENQEYADKRLPILAEIPAAIRWVSYEPALGPIDFRPYLDFIDWIVVGGESGPGAREFQEDWAYETVCQCRESGVAAFVKQMGSNPMRMNGYGSYKLNLKDPKGGDIEEFRSDLRVREYPGVKV